MEIDAVFDAKAEEQPKPQPVETPAPEPTPPAQAAPAPEPDAPPATPSPAAEPERTAPLTALLDERDRRKAAERERDELKAAQQARQQPGAIPDPYDDPAGYQAHVAQLVEARALNTRFELSETLARDKHGDETVDKAMAWGQEQAQRNPGFRTDFLAQKNPIDWVVRQQKREGLLSEVGEDPDAFVRRRAAEMGLIAAPDAGAGVVSAPEQQQAPKPAAPPRSIAAVSGTGAGAHDVPTGPLAGLDAVFKR